MLYKTETEQRFPPAAHSHFPYYGCINPPFPPFLFVFISYSMIWIFSASRFSCFFFHHRWKTRKATQHKSNISIMFPKLVPISVDTCPNGFKLFNPSWRFFNKSDPVRSGKVLQSGQNLSFQVHNLRSEILMSSQRSFYCSPSLTHVKWYRCYAKLRRTSIPF